MTSQCTPCGGLLAWVFDELLSEVQSLAPPVGMTACLEVADRHLTPIETDLVFEGWIDEDCDRSIVGKGTCALNGKGTAEASALFVRVDFRQVAGRDGPGVVADG